MLFARRGVAIVQRANRTVKSVEESKEARRNVTGREGDGSRPLARTAIQQEWDGYELGLGREILDYLAPVRRQWRIVAILTFVATISGWAMSHLLLTKLYRAEAIIKPMTPQQTLGLMQGYTLGVGDGLFSSFMGSQYNAGTAEEDITILGTYTFLTDLAKEHHMDEELLEHEKPRNGADKSWMVYRILRSRFENTYSSKTGNLTLTYLDKNRRRAAKVLGWEITDLRQILRAREVHNASAATSALEQQVKNVSDTLLARQLYELIAKQIQREKLAEVQADFAFEVLQPPVTPDHPAWPYNALDGLLVGFFTFCAASGVIVLWNLIRPARLGTSSEAMADRD